MEDKKEIYRYRYCEFATKLIESLSQKLLQIITFNPDILDLINDHEANIQFVKRVGKISKAMKLMESNSLVPKPFFSQPKDLNDTLQRLYNGNLDNSSACSSLAVTPAESRLVPKRVPDHFKSQFIDSTTEKQLARLRKSQSRISVDHMYSLTNENDLRNNQPFKTCSQDFITENRTPDAIKALE